MNNSKMDARCFSNLTAQQRKDMKFDDYSLGSTIHTTVANAIIQEIKKANNGHYPNFVADLTAGIGGMTVEFAKTCEKVIAIEIDPERSDLLQHNLGIAEVDVKFHVGDFMSMPGVFKSADVIFVDADASDNKENVISRTGNSIEDAKQNFKEAKAEQDNAKKDGLPPPKKIERVVNVNLNEILPKFEENGAKFQLFVAKIGATFNLINFELSNPSYDVSVVDKKMGGSRLLLVKPSKS